MGDDTRNRCRFTLTCDQETMAQFLSNAVPTPVLSSTRVTLCLFKDAATHPCLVWLTFSSVSECHYLHRPPNLPRWETKQGKSCVDKGRLDSPQHPVSRCTEASVFIDSSWMPTESGTKPADTLRCAEVSFAAAWAFPSISLGKEDSVISRLKL